MESSRMKYIPISEKKGTRNYVMIAPVLCVSQNSPLLLGYTPNPNTTRIRKARLVR